MREVNNTNLSLADLIKKKLHENDFDFGNEYIDAALTAGHFTLLLDGFDEVEESRRSLLAKEIDELATRFSHNTIIVSSRPDNSLRWDLFRVWQIRPLPLSLAIELINKTNTDPDVKAKFVADLENGLFEKHESFLANPLLLSIMLITYENSANIPHKITTFFERAYTALFEQHDARKAYHRIKRTNLDIADFRRVFSAFCFLSYIKNAYSFSDANLYDYLEKAKAISQVEFNISDYVQDATQAVCLLIRDGLEIAFSHRTFQEYFASDFNSRIGEASIRQNFLLQQASKTSAQESLDLSIQIAPDVVETDFIVPQLAKLSQAVGYLTTYGDEQHLKLLTHLYSHLTIIEEDEDREQSLGLTIRQGPSYQAVRLARTMCSPGDVDVDVSDKYFEVLDYVERFSRDIDFASGVPMEKVAENTLLREYLTSGTHWMSRAYYEEVLNVRRVLEEKHNKNINLLEEAVFNLPDSQRLKELKRPESPKAT